MAEEQTTRVRSLDAPDLPPEGSYDNTPQTSGGLPTGTQQGPTQPTWGPKAEEPLEGTLHDRQSPSTDKEDDFSSLKPDSPLILLRARQGVESRRHKIYGSSDERFIGSDEDRLEQQRRMWENTVMVAKSTAELSRNNTKRLLFVGTVSAAMVAGNFARLWMSNAPVHNEVPQTTTDLDGLAAPTIQSGSGQIDQKTPASMSTGTELQELVFDIRNTAAELMVDGQQTCTIKPEDLVEFVKALRTDVATVPTVTLESGSIDQRKEGSRDASDSIV